MRNQTHSTLRSGPKRVALVTGATSGLGQALSCFLQTKGYLVLTTGRQPNSAQNPHYLSADLKNRKDRARIIKWIGFHKPDLIINNAGYGLYGEALNLSTTEQLEVLEVNIMAVYEITLESARMLKQSNKCGTILNISSVAAFLPYPAFNSYAASKACVVNFSQALNYELKTSGIRVLTACPGQISTRFAYKASGGRYRETDRFSMSLDRAVKMIWKQICQGNAIYIFDWRYRLSLFISKVLPESVLVRFLRSVVLKRVSDSL
jgi:short-subunit dehydrogenase